jgi:hypothetical protein
MDRERVTTSPLYLNFIQVSQSTHIGTRTYLHHMTINNCMHKNDSEKLKVSQLIKKFSALQETEKYVTVYTTSGHWNLL